MVVLLYRFRVRVVMELTHLLKLLALIILLGYFINKILVAKTKLYDGKIGTLLRKIGSDTVKGSLCYCLCYLDTLPLIAIAFHVIMMLPCNLKKQAVFYIYSYISEFIQYFAYFSITGTLLQYPAITACVSSDYDKITNSYHNSEYMGGKLMNGPKNIVSRYIYFYKMVNG